MTGIIFPCGNLPLFTIICYNNDMQNEPRITRQSHDDPKDKPKGVVAIRHTTVLKNMVENGGKKGKVSSVSKAARKVGYSEAYVRSGKLQKTLSWGRSVAMELPNEDLLAVHREGLKATTQEARITGWDKLGKPIYKIVKVPDYATRLRYLDAAYKITRKYNDDISRQSEPVEMTLEQVKAEQNKIIARMLETKWVQKYIHEKYLPKAQEPIPPRLQRNTDY